MISANSISLEGVDYATAVQVLRDSGQTVNLVVKRRVVLPPQPQQPPAHPTLQQDQPHQQVQQVQVQHDVKVTLNRGRKSKEDFGVVLGCKIYVREVARRSAADRDGTVREGDVVSRINGQSTEGMTLKEARKMLEASKDRLDLVVRRERKKSKPVNSAAYGQTAAAAAAAPASMPPLVRPAENATPPRPPLPTSDVADDGKLAFSQFLFFYN